MPDRKPRRGLELICEYVFRPAAHLLARALAPLRVPPPAVVLAGTCTGGAAALALARGHLLAAALLLQLKTLLDNADGQLARLSGRITAFGRYLDSESDLLVDAALFAALGLRVGPWLALSGFVALTAVLSANFNVERVFRAAHGEPARPSQLPHGAAARLLARAYDAFYGPQDRLFDTLARRRPRAWHEPVAVHVLANFGLSTQLAALGACLALGRPAAYVYAVLGCAAVVALLAVRREALVRRAGRPVPAVD
jgi:phosphatidylglycerophosphate synthase